MSNGMEAVGAASLDRPSTLVVGNYRSFPERSPMRLAPITMLYGWNNAGKSALLRMLALVGHSVRESASAPLDLSLFEPGLGFQRLFWRGDDTLPADAGVFVGLEWAEGHAPMRIEYWIDYSDEQNRSYIRAFRIADERNGVIEWEVDRAEASLRRFTRREVAASGPMDMRFVGLVPPPGITELEGMRQRMMGLRERIQWLEAVRARPPAEFSSSGSVPALLAKNGSNAIQVLLTDPALLKRVAEFYRNGCDRILDLKEIGPGKFRTTLAPKSVPLMDVDLADTGEGMMQVLPVLVAAAMAERANGPCIVAIEEPESHLHPKAQVALAKFLCAVATTPHRPALVLETHSHALILGMQTAIASGIIPPDDVCVYWLEPSHAGATELREVGFARSGAPKSDDLRGIFAEEADMIRELSDNYLGG